MSATATHVRPRRTRGTGLGLAAWVLGIVFFLPIAWMALTSFHSEPDAAKNPPSFGAALTLDGYREFFGTGGGASPGPRSSTPPWRRSCPPCASCSWLSRRLTRSPSAR